jgi:23S rRNA pseudouridine2605 synthase
LDDRPAKRYGKITDRRESSSDRTPAKRFGRTSSESDLTGPKKRSGARTSEGRKSAEGEERAPSKYVPRKSSSRNTGTSKFIAEKGESADRFAKHKLYEKGEHKGYLKKGLKKPFQKFKSEKFEAKPKQKEYSEDGLTRLNKYIANAGICSRREADQLIESGVIAVNGKVITELGYKISPVDIVQYGGQSIRREKLVYILLNKPKDYITTMDDPLERKTVMALIQGAGPERVYPVGRLDRATTGLLLLTNDGELTKRLTHPRYEKKKIYHVYLDKAVKAEDLRKLREGVMLEDGEVKADEVSYVTGATSKKEVGIELHSGKNRVIRRLFEALGYKVIKLDRVYFAGLTKKDLPRGKWRFLSEKEVNMLKMSS